MHAGQVELDVATVERLVAARFPHWTGQPVRPVASRGTVNALFRVGEDTVLRFPLRPSAAEERREELTREQIHARRIAERVPVAVSRPLGLAAPGPGYDGWWTAYRWISGVTADAAASWDDEGLATDLAAFVDALHTMETGGARWDGAGRGGPLADRDAAVREALAASAELTDVPAVARVWRRCAAAPAATSDVWIHGDLMPGNLVLRAERLAAVIDFETTTVGDAAVDLMPAWNLLDAPGRRRFRRALGVDDATWERGRGWAIAQASVALPYYVESNPAMADIARRTLAAVLE